MSKCISGVKICSKIQSGPEASDCTCINGVSAFQRARLEGFHILYTLYIYRTQFNYLYEHSNSPNGIFDIILHPPNSLHMMNFEFSYCSV